MLKIQSFFQGYLDELTNKVSWPTVEELQSTTITVLVASVILAVVIMVVDFVFKEGMAVVYGILQ